MLKKNRIIFGAVILISFLIITLGFAFSLVTKEEAIKNAFTSECQIVSETKDLTGANLEKVKSKLGGKLVHFQKGSQSAKVDETTKFEFNFAVKNKQKVGVSILDSEPGKWGPVDYIISLDMAGKVTRVEVMAYVEKRGRPIAARNFMGQFDGKTGADPIKLRDDIRGITGATISSEASCFAVRKAITLYETIYLNK